MFRRFSANFAAFSLFLDLLIVAGSLWLAVFLRPLFNPLPHVQPLESVPPLPLLVYILFPLLWVGVHLLFSVYDGRRNFRVVDEFTSLSFSTVLAAVAMAGVLYLSFREVSRVLFLSFVIISYLFQLAWRLLIRVVFRYRWLRGTNKRRVLILGAGTLGAQMQQCILQQPMLDLEIAGFLDDDLTKQAARPDVLGSLGQARAMVESRAIDDVVVTLPRSADARLTQVVGELHDLPVRVWIALDYFALTLHRAQVQDFAGIPMLDLRAPALSEYQRILKRVFDLAVVLLTLPFSLLLMGAIALLIRLVDGTPVLYLTERVGENGRIFKMLKFRSMVVDAEARRQQVLRPDENGNLLHKRIDDPRITRIGRFLRRSSLDELPNLFNVLKGEMSLVGPRPELPYLVEKYDLWQRKRFAVPQGMTGWWQVNGRSDKPMHLHTEEDLYYVQHYSLWLDVQILLKTVWVVLRGKGAF